MNSNILLKRCFNCRNNINCWHLNDYHPRAGKYANEVKLKPISVIKFLFKTHSCTLKEFEYFCVRSCIELISPTIKNDNEMSHAYTQRVMLVIEGIACCRDDWWDCPSYDSESNESFAYIPIR